MQSFASFFYEKCLCLLVLFILLCLLFLYTEKMNNPAIQQAKKRHLYDFVSSFFLFFIACHPFLAQKATLHFTAHSAFFLLTYS